MRQFGIGQPVRRVEDRRFLTGRGHYLDDIVRPRQAHAVMLLAGQVNGGIAQGIGQAMPERCVYDEGSGQLVTGTLTDYALPRADDLPALEFSYNVVPCLTNPLGVKGAGEAGAIGAPPALVNAVVDAVAELGIDHLDMPLTPELLWRAVRDAAAAKAA